MARFEGLTEYQKDLLQVAQKELPKEVDRILKNAARKGARMALQRANAEVGKVNNIYHKKFKAGKVFDGYNGERVVRVINSAPHAHLVEYGHDQVVNPPRTDGKRGVKPGKGIGRKVGEVPGRLTLTEAMKQFEQKREFEKALSRGIDSLLRRGKL